MRRRNRRSPRCSRDANVIPARPVVVLLLWLDSNRQTKSRCGSPSGVGFGAHLRDQRDVADPATLNMRPRPRALESRGVQLDRKRGCVSLSNGSGLRLRSSPCGSVETWCPRDRSASAESQQLCSVTVPSNLRRAAMSHAKAGGWPKLNILGRPICGCGI